MGQATHHVNFWTLEEFELFISELKQPRTILGFNILYWTGCRVGEMLALTPIDFSNNEMSISKTLLRLDDGQQIIHTPKTVASKRNVSLPDFLVKMIKDYINRLKLESTDLLFLAPGQKHIDKGFLRWSMESYSKKIGIKRLRIHDLRHSHASLLIKMGFSPVDIAARLGHDKVETTLNTYSHLWPNAAKKLADDLENVHSTKKAVRF
jgi:integrase